MERKRVIPHPAPAHGELWRQRRSNLCSLEFNERIVIVRC